MKTLITTYLIFSITVLSLTAQESANGKILIVLPQSEFSANEYTELTKIFKGNGFDVEVASSSMGSALGIHGAVVTPNLQSKNVNVENYKAIIFPGGNGVESFYQDTTIYQMIKQADKKAIVIGALSLAPTLLAKAGILEHHNVTGEYSPIFEDSNATYKGSTVEISGNIITAKDSDATIEFAFAVIKKLGINIIQNAYNLNPTQNCTIEYRNDKKGYVIQGNDDEVFSQINNKYFLSKGKCCFKINNDSTVFKLLNYQFKDCQGQLFIDNKKIGTAQKSDIIILYPDNKIDVYNRERVTLIEKATTKK